MKLRNQVQIFPNQPGLGTLLGTGLGSGIGESLSSIAEHKLGQMIQRQQAGRTQKGIELLQSGDPQSVAQGISLLPSNMQQEAIKDLRTQGQQANYQAELGRILGGLAPQEAQQPGVPTQQPGGVPGEAAPAIAPREPLAQTYGAPTMSDQQSASLAKIRGKLQKEARKKEEEIKKLTSQEKVAAKKLAFEEQKEVDKETLPVFKEVIKTGKTEMSDMRLNRMEVLNEKGDLGPSTGNMIVKTIKKGLWGAGALDLTRLMTADAIEFDKLSTDFIKDAKEIFGARLTDTDVRTFLQTIPTLMQSKEGRQRVIRNLRLFNAAKKARKKAMISVIKENKGRRPRHMELLIDERARPELDRISNEFMMGAPRGVGEAAETGSKPIKGIGDLLSRGVQDIFGQYPQR